MTKHRIYAMTFASVYPMYVAKAGRRGMSVYEADGDANSPARLILLGDLRRALDDREQLSVHYQPLYELTP